MDQRQQYDPHGKGYSGSGMQRLEAGDFLHRHGPCYPPERDGNYGNEPVVTSFAYTHREIYTARRSARGDASNVQRGLGISPPNNSNDPVGGTFQQEIYRRNQEGGTSRPDFQPRYSDSIVPYGSNTDWMANEPSERMSTSFDNASNFQYTASTTACANCRNYSHIDNDPINQPDQGDIGSNTDWRIQEVEDCFLGPSEQDFQAIRQLPTEELRHDITYIEDLEVPILEQPTGFSFRNRIAIDALGNPLIVLVDKDCANKGLTKKRKRKPRTVKPRKPRTLTEKGKAHAKAVRECPGGACEDCKRRKTKARDPEMKNLGSTRL